MNSKIVAFIPARGGSKGIPGKNIRKFAGKPLIVHSIEQAISTPQIESVYVSSDDPTILKISENSGALAISRPQLISGDSATTESAVDHFLELLEADNNLPDVIVLLQATSPHRPENSLSHAIDHFLTNKFDSLVSLSPTHHFF